MNELALHVEESAHASLSVSDDSCSLNIGGQFYAIGTPEYSGNYEIEPSENYQTIPMEGLRATHNVVIDPIPNNYGLITYDGTGITVS